MAFIIRKKFNLKLLPIDRFPFLQQPHAVLQSDLYFVIHFFHVLTYVV